MDSTSEPISLLSQTFLLAFFLLSLPSVKTLSDHRTLVYKNCTNQTFTESTKSHSQTLSSFFEELIAHSSNSKFFKTTIGDGGAAVSGLFQCRGDLTNSECYNCINTLPAEILSGSTFCSKAVSSRIQLQGCYVRYETDEYFRDDDERSKHELLHKTCGKEKAVTPEFEEMRDAAFAAMESGVVSDYGFYSANYELVHVMAQCEGDLGACDCGECVNIAVQIAQEECGGSVSGQIYLDKCFVSYTYYPYGIPGNSFPDKKRNENNNDTGKKVAIVLGGAAALIFGFILLLFMKNLRKKDDDS